MFVEPSYLLVVKTMNLPYNIQFVRVTKTFSAMLQCELNYYIIIEIYFTYQSTKYYYCLQYVFSLSINSVTIKNKQSVTIKIHQINQLHAVFRTQQGRHRESSVKTLRFPLSAKFWRHCVLSDRTQRRA